MLVDYLLLAAVCCVLREQGQLPQKAPPTATRVSPHTASADTRHLFCTTALFTWKLDATDVSCMAGHTNVRTTLLMYVGSTAGVLDRARTATN